MRTLNSILATACVAVVATTGIAANAATIQYLGQCLPTDLSANGSVIVGNMPDNYETFRWTQADGIVRLGRSTVDTLGVGGGSPDVSADGTKVSACILNDAGTHSTWGKWTLGTGWQTLALPANASPSGDDEGGPYGMSGDGNKVVGLYWISGGRAHAGVGTVAGGVTDLGSGTESSRANAANYDGSVVVGWEGSQRHPAVWVNGVKTILESTVLVDTEVSAVNADGTVVGGNHYDTGISTRGAEIWRYSGGTWTGQFLGVLPGTAPNTSGAIVDDLSADGSIAVGFNRFNNSNFADATGFYWSAATGLISADQLFANLGLTVPDNFQILELTSISSDGSTIAGIGLDADGYQGFVIAVPEPSALCLLGLALPLVRRRRQK